MYDNANSAGFMSQMAEYTCQNRVSHEKNKDGIKGIEFTLMYC